MVAVGPDWEKDIYSKGRQLNKWPYLEVISAFSAYLASWNQNRRPRVLEVGCGTGNNLRALGEMGFEVSGIEVSETAANVARGILGTEVEIVCGSMDTLPWGDEKFDYVLDRGGLTHVQANLVPSVISEVIRVLVPEGIFHSETLFSEAHPDRRFGVELPTGSYGSFSSGFFTRVGCTTFFTERKLRELLSEFRRVTISRSTRHQGTAIVSEVFGAVAQK